MERYTYFDHGKYRLMFDGVEYSNKFVDRLAHYEDLEEQGRLVVLPIKIGDTVHYKDACGNVVGEAKILEAYYNGKSLSFYVHSKDNAYFELQVKEILLTHAEAALTPTPASDVPEGE